MKTCTKCKIEKDFSGFSPCGHTRDRLHSWCKQCNIEQARKYYEKNREKISLKNKKWNKENKRTRNSYRIKYLYGITQERYEELYAQQTEKCAICLIHCEKLHIHHSHKTGKVRGLLCKACNMSLGSMKEDIKRLENAIAYLRRYDENEL